MDTPTKDSNTKRTASTLDPSLLDPSLLDSSLLDPTQLVKKFPLQIKYLTFDTEDRLYMYIHRTFIAVSPSIQFPALKVFILQSLHDYAESNKMA